MNVLVTGGLGYIGSHFVVEALNAGFHVTVIDNLVNSSRAVINNIRKINPTPFKFIQGDIRDIHQIKACCEANQFDAVVHFAGLKSVCESHNIPLDYYETNVVGSLNILKVMQESRIKKIIFSSSAAVYGDLNSNACTETQATRPIHPYGQTKYTVEQMLENMCQADPEFSAMSLRYFNPVGAHASGLIDELPQGVPNNLMPYITQVAQKKLPYLRIFGDDYPTQDGTCVRDYIHVLDLVAGHLKALLYIDQHTGAHLFNLGTGKGYSVLQVVKAFGIINQCTIPYKILPRRTGDLAAYWADAHQATIQLGWQAKRSLYDMVRHDVSLR
ncbi:MAG: UDP-glucose 4-epimerase GalE [Gammaproteobacteria bacterium]|nr:UDP-glucose 4-epimerase GalE [Gammaproteobacteria bacterium]